ncbi:MAG: hypothetical protein CEO22_245 [Candidatus Berkelbacteria bacterium Gr01-1014_85]|uniref:Nudix hydrolase domain-containing protein n=1 Tax=Candidatus Berkelbacteria bacterium Gr01-1014_85 TaxID=2017150 RepID=A0A554JCF9_9BACT|nr:MAG: hypothetical protein CEO22_245 [Candidatus Berkelbacteria bacterium Gr01-1014_85]
MKQGVNYVGVTVTFLCHDGQGNFLLAKRSKMARDEHGKWDGGGGALELGATVLATLKKEIKEEYCADVIEHEFLGYRDILRHHDGHPTHWIALDHKVLVSRDQVKNGEPHKFDELGWFTLASLPDSLHSQLPAFISAYNHRLASTDQS